MSKATRVCGRSGPTAASEKWDTQLYGISGQYAFGEFSIDADLPDPEVTFRLMADSGSAIYKLTLTRSQLTPPASGIRSQELGVKNCGQGETANA